MPEATGDRRQDQGAGAESIADYAAYLLENECGLPKGESLRASAAALRENINALLTRGEVNEQEMQFLVAQAIDIMPNPEFGAAARAQGFSEQSVSRIEHAYRSVIEAMRVGRESL